VNALLEKTRQGLSRVAIILSGGLNGLWECFLAHESVSFDLMLSALERTRTSSSNERNVETCNPNPFETNHKLSAKQSARAVARGRRQSGSEEKPWNVYTDPFY
jgi:hypothetical protein